jgi:hypothetical protein
VLTTSSTVAFGPATTSSSGFAEAPIGGARIDVNAAQIPTARAGLLPLPPAQPKTLLSPRDPILMVASERRLSITLAFVTILDGCYPVSGRIFRITIDLAPGEHG